MKIRYTITAESELSSEELKQLYNTDNIEAVIAADETVWDDDPEWFVNALLQQCDNVKLEIEVIKNANRD